MTAQIKTPRQKQKHTSSLALVVVTSNIHRYTKFKIKKNKHSKTKQEINNYYNNNNSR